MKMFSIRFNQKGIVLKNPIKLIILAIIIIAVIIVGYFLLVKKAPEIKKDVASIYFSKIIGSDIELDSVERKIPIGENHINYAIDQLLMGPTQDEQDQGFYSEIPVGTRLIDLIESPAEVRINLNKQFISGGGSNSVVFRLKQLSNTAIDAEPVRKIFLDIDGVQLETIGGEGLEVVQPLVKGNTSPNKDDQNN